MMTDRRDAKSPLGTRDVATLFGVTMKTIHRWAESGRRARSGVRSPTPRRRTSRCSSSSPGTRCRASRTRPARRGRCD